MIFFFSPEANPLGRFLFLSLFFLFFFFSAGHNPASFVCSFRRIVSGIFVVLFFRYHLDCPASHPLILSSTHPLFSPSPCGEGRGGVIPPFGISLFVSANLGGLEMPLCPSPPPWGSRRGLPYLRFSLFSAFFSFPSCIFHFFVVPLHPITIL